MRRALATAAFLFAAALVWAGKLAFGPGPWAADSAAVLAADLLVLTAVSLVGMLVAGSRWARRLGVAVALATAFLAVALPADPAWWAGLVFSTGALGGLAGTGMKGVVRERPAAAGPPDEAVVLPILLLAAAAVVAASRPSGLGAADWVAVGVAVVTAAVYVKAWPGALLAARLAAPLALIAGGAAGGLPAGLGVAVVGVVAGRFAWTTAARVAVRPLVERGNRVPIPAELAPHDILHAAGLDERGRPRGHSS